MMDKLKSWFKNTQRLTWFFLISGLLLVIYAPHIRFTADLESTTDGTLVLSHFNTDRGEEIFTDYNYNSHKVWNDVTYRSKEVVVSTVPIVTDSIRVELDYVDEMNIRAIRMTFGPFTLKEYNADTFTESIIASDGLDISIHDNLITLSVQNTKGWIQFEKTEYFSKIGWCFVYGLLLAIAWGIAYMLDKHVDFISHIPLHEVYLLAVPLWIFFMSEMILGDIYYIDIAKRFLNVGIYIVIYKVMDLIFRGKPISILITNLGVIMFSIVAYFTVLFRNRPIAPWDITAVGTALDVASNYDLSIPYFMIIALLLGVLLYLIAKLIPYNQIRINKYYIAYPIIIVVIALFFNSVGQYYLWDMNLLSTYQSDGTALTFTGLFRQYLGDQPTKPDGYSQEKLEEIMTKMEADAEKNVGDGVVPANIIMIMNESFCDLTIGGNPRATGLTPYINELDNTIRGNLYVSVRGGGTCNSEYETLTGNTTAFFAGGVYPYNMYMHREVPSLVSYFNAHDYHTTGIHLGKSTNWNRKAAYKRLQFENTVFAETFEGLRTVHGYPTDEQHYEKMIETYEETKDEPNFIFNVTYQNHGGFLNANDLKKTVDLSAWGDLEKAENYMSLLRLSDTAYKDMIEYYSKVKEPTLIIMYGDHQPSLGAKADAFFFPNQGTPKQDIKKYITPFVIWANYDIEDQTIDKISTNYLSSLILKTANMKMTPYQQFLYELSQEYPVISMYGCFDKNNRFYESVNDIDDELIEEYRMLQYNNVFDKNRIDELFYPEADKE